MDRSRLCTSFLRSLGFDTHRGPAGGRELLRRSVVLLSAALVLVAGCWSDPSVISDEPALGGVRLVEVTDGDSLVVEIDGEERPVRLMGINAPERDECWGPESTSHLADLVGAGNLTMSIADEDQYQRLLAYVSVDDLVVNVAQVEAGMAIAFSGGGSLQPQIFAAEDRARSAGAGWWGSGACGGRPAVELTLSLEQADPPGPDGEHLEGEIVIIRSDETIDLSGYVLRDESTVNRLIFPEGTILEAGQELTITSACGRLGWCRGSPIWNNGGDTALLVSPGGALIATDRYVP